MSFFVLRISIFLSIIVVVPFFILLERKFLGYIQFRKGPKKKRIFGLLQSFSDAGKLLLKFHSTIFWLKIFVFQILPCCRFFILLFNWILLPFKNSIFWFNLSIFGFLCLSALNVYTIFGSGWRRKKKYSFLGSIRGAAQKISYEIKMLFLIFFFVIFRFGLRFNQSKSFLFFVFRFFVLLWFLTVVAECNRAPLDFAEGERELVSGFSTEYSGPEFALIMLREYGRIILLCFITCCLQGFFFQTTTRLVLSFLILFFRGRFPRFRYDLTMIFAWIYILPSCCFCLMIFFFLVFYAF